ncbi:MAG: hypothetical protein DCF30_08675 [Hyphomicrobiales bacterium]|nr:MAG: hypothetical protein DCF30_08675 [Hyphomicrobiales bacterium]
MLDDAILKDVAAKIVTPHAKQKAMAHACTMHAVSQRRACLASKINHSTVTLRSIITSKKQTQRNILHLGSAPHYVTVCLERIKKPPPASP